MAKRVLLEFAVVVVILISNRWAVAQQQKIRQPERIAISDLKKKLDSGEKFLMIDVRED